MGPHAPHFDHGTVTKHPLYDDKKRGLAANYPRQSDWPPHWPAREGEGEFFLPEGRHYGALFAYQVGFGVVYDNAVYLCEAIGQPLVYYPVVAPLLPHPVHTSQMRNPLVAAYIPSAQQITVMLSEYHAAQYGTTLGTLRIVGKRVQWDDTLFAIDFSAIETAVSGRSEPIPRVLFEDQHIGSIHAVQPDLFAISAIRGYILSDIGRYRYSVLAHVHQPTHRAPPQQSAVNTKLIFHHKALAWLGYGRSAEPQATITAAFLKTLPHGRTLYSMDGNWLLIHIGKYQEAQFLQMYTIDGELVDALALTPDVLGNLGDFDLIFDHHGDALWLANASTGRVAHYRLHAPKIPPQG